MNEVALFENALRAAVRVQPDPRLGQSLVPQLAQAARTATLEAGTVTSTAKPARSRRALVARIGIAVAALPLLFAGLAAAGVTVPDPARSAFESVGIALPNQPPDDVTQNQSSGATSQESSGGAPADQASDQGKEASAKKGANGKAKGKDDSAKPGRRVRRHGQGPVPGPATAPPGRALGLAKEHGNSSSHAKSGGGSGRGNGRGGGSAHAGGSQSNSGNHGKP